MTEKDIMRILHAVWPDWHYERILGSGTYGTVILAKQTDGTEAAVKLIFIRYSQSIGVAFTGEDTIGCYLTSDCETAVEDCRREIALQRSLQMCPYIVSLQDSAICPEENGRGYTVLIRMERLTPLRALLPLSEQEVVRMGSDICKAMQFCAEKNILHRDIKPDNIFRDDSGNYKLGDFGVSRLLEAEQVHLTQNCGTPLYMSPESMNSTLYDTRADLYSLGLVMYTVLNEGRGPFMSTDKHILTSRDRLYAQQKRLSGEAFPDAKNASPALMRVLRKACAFRAESRYQSAAAMQNALTHLQQQNSKCSAAGMRGIVTAAVVTVILLMLAAVTLSALSPAETDPDCTVSTVSSLSPTKPLPGMGDLSRECTQCNTSSHM